MAEIVIGSGGSRILVKGEDKTLQKIAGSDFAAKYIPSYSVSNNRAGISLRLTLKKGTLLFSAAYPDFSLVFPEGSLSSQDFITMIDYCLEYDRQAKGSFTIHGSACAKADKGVLIFGPVSGLGKTSLMLELCKNHKFFPLADEKVVISAQRKIVGGVSALSLDKAAISKILGSRRDSYDLRSGRLIPAAKDKADLSLVVLPIIAEGSRLVIEKLSAAEADWHFYEEASRKIRGTSRRIADFGYAPESLDTQETSLNRINAIRDISTQVEFIRIRGSLPEAAEEVNRILA